MSNQNKFPVLIKRHSRARKMKLRYDPMNECAVVTMPPRGSEKAAIKFAEQNLIWLEKQKTSSPEQIFLSPGSCIPYKGETFIIIHRADRSGRIQIEDNSFIVGGPIEGFPVRLENFLKKQARLTIEPIARDMSLLIRKRFVRIQIRDTSSRWGSCSSSGTLSFSWRLILTPPEILTYVVAHEIAHLKEMNHSPAFWAVVDQMVDNAKSSRKWLKTEGQQLMLIRSELPNYP